MSLVKFGSKRSLDTRRHSRNKQIVTGRTTSRTRSSGGARRLEVGRGKKGGNGGTGIFFLAFSLQFLPSVQEGLSSFHIEHIFRCEKLKLSSGDGHRGRDVKRRRRGHSGNAKKNIAFNFYKTRANRRGTFAQNYSLPELDSSAESLACVCQPARSSSSRAFQLRASWEIISCGLRDLSAATMGRCALQ